MFRQSVIDAPSVNEEASRRQQIVSTGGIASSSSTVKPHPLHNFPLSDLRWAMNNHSNNTHHRRGRSPLRESNTGRSNNLVIEEDVHEASGSSFETTTKKKKKKSTTADGRSKIFIRIRTKNNEESSGGCGGGDVATTATATATTTVVDEEIDADRISDGGDEFGPKTWNLRPRKPPPTKKRSIGVLKNCSLPQGTVRTEAIRSRNNNNHGGAAATDANVAKIVATERKEKKPRLSISLSKLEIDEDIYALTGSKPSRRPKKRAKNVQKQLDVLFPGLWMGNVSSDAYKVSEHA